MLREGGRMKILLNGKEREVQTESSVQELLEQLSKEHKLSLEGSVVLYNDTLLKKENWNTTKVEASSKIDVLSFVSGG